MPLLSCSTQVLAERLSKGIRYEGLARETPDALLTHWVTPEID